MIHWWNLEYPIDFSFVSLIFCLSEIDQYSCLPSVFIPVDLWAYLEDLIPVELFQILKDDAVKVLHSICQQIWKTQQWPQDWKRSVFIPISKKAMPKNAQTTAQLHSSHMLVK